MELSYGKFRIINERVAYVNEKGTIERERETSSLVLEVLLSLTLFFFFSSSLSFFLEKLLSNASYDLIVTNHLLI